MIICMDNPEKTENAMDCGMEYCQYKSSKEDQNGHSLTRVQSMSNACIQLVYNIRLKRLTRTSAWPVSIANCNEYGRMIRQDRRGIPQGNEIQQEDSDDRFLQLFSSFPLFHCLELQLM